MESGLQAPPLPARGRLAREASGKRKTNEITNVFSNLASNYAPGGRIFLEVLRNSVQPHKKG